MPRWSRHSTPEALKDRPQLQTDCRTHTYTHKGHNQSRNNRETCTHTHTHGPSERRPSLTPPNRQRGGGVGVCRRESGNTRTDVSLAADRSDRSLSSHPSSLFSLFFQSASLFYFSLLDCSHLHLPSTLSSDWPTPEYTRSSPLPAIIHLLCSFFAFPFSHMCTKKSSITESTSTFH